MPPSPIGSRSLYGPINFPWRSIAGAGEMPATAAAAGASRKLAEAPWACKSASTRPLKSASPPQARFRYANRSSSEPRSRASEKINLMSGTAPIVGRLLYTGGPMFNALFLGDLRHGPGISRRLVLRNQRAAPSSFRSARLPRRCVGDRMIGQFGITANHCLGLATEEQSGRLFVLVAPT